MGELGTIAAMSFCVPKWECNIQKNSVISSHTGYGQMGPFFTKQIFSGYKYGSDTNNSSIITVDSAHLVLLDMY